MKKMLNLGVVLTLLFATSEIAAQSDIALATRAAKLQSLSEKLKKRDQKELRQAQVWADHIGIPLRRELPNGKVLELQRFTPGKGPIFYITNNVDAADSVSTDEVWPGGSAGLFLDGSGMTIGEWDAGAILGDHPDLYNRVTQVDGATELSNHSTHVAGTLIGAGVAQRPEARGMAYAALLDAYDWNSDTAEMASAAANGLLLSNHSYGIVAGWLYLGGSPPDTWWWIGGSDPTDVEDRNFGYYDTESQLWDQIAFDAPYYLIVKAAGNDRWDTGPEPGEQYTVVNQNGEFQFVSTLSRNADCAPAGYDCLPTASVAKNILTVGSVDDVPGGYLPLAGPAGVQISSFSGWGPTDDGRIKPDVVGNGWLLMSTYAQDPYFAAALGTSMAAPNVSGSLLLLQQHYQDLHGANSFMRAATLKALAIHSADETGAADGPDYEYGWGLLNTKTAARLISEDGGGDHEIIEGNLANGATDTVTITVDDPDAFVTATLVWTDPPATPAVASLDPPDLMLVNDLDLRIANGGPDHLPWVLDPTSPADPATTGDNFRDNVEQVVVSGGGAGSYSVQVSHKGTLLNSNAQDYSLIISIDPPPPVSSGLVIDEDFSQGLPAGWSILTSKGAAWTIRTPVNGDARYDNHTGSGGNFAMVDNYVDGSFFNTSTSLQTPMLDLSSAQAAVLSFNSYFVYDFYESINVDVSTNGGSGWTTVWQHQGFSNIPIHHTLDLSGSIAGHTNVLLRFRFASGMLGPDGNLWQIDNIALEAFGGTVPPTPPPEGQPPGQADNPLPDGSSSNIGLDTVLYWSPGQLATSHNVYLGTDSALSDPSEFIGNQATTSFDPGSLAYDTNYYWRIDEVNDDGTTQGVTWSFTTEAAPQGNPPGQAGAPNPADGASGLGLNTVLSWTAGAATNTHQVYFDSNDPPVSAGAPAGASFDPGSLAYATTYYWRVDEVNGDGTTTGNTWTFSTEAAPAATINLTGLSGNMIPGSRGRWTAEVEISVEDQGDNPESDVTVEGNWSNGANGSISCVTVNGSCTVEKTRLKNQVSSVTFTVTNLVKGGSTYSPEDNDGSDTLVVGQSSADKLPSAKNDSYQTIANSVVNGNVIDNDDQGDAPASANVATFPSNGSLNLASDGAFTYTPDTDFEGSNSFTYSISDQDGDISNTATVSITVTAEEPPPPSGALSVSARAYKVKGVQHVDVTWLNYSSATVDISRNGSALGDSPISNNASYVDNIGVKGGGSYTYKVCEANTSNCESASATF